MRLPFAAMVTIEIATCCAAIAAALMIISYVTTSGSNSTCLKQGTHAVTTLTTQIQNASTYLVCEILEQILSQPVNTLRESSSLFNQSLLNFDNYDMLWPYFYWQLAYQPAVTLIYFGAKSGDFVGAARPYLPANDSVIIEIKSSSSNSKCTSSCSVPGFDSSLRNYMSVQQIDYTASLTGNIIRQAPYNTTHRPWYLQAAEVPTCFMTWTVPYTFTNGIDIGITATLPMYKDQEIIGVLAADISFNSIRVQLTQLSKNLTSNAFVMVFNEYGYLFATSNANEPTACLEESNGVYLSGNATSSINNSDHRVGSGSSTTTSSTSRESPIHIPKHISLLRDPNLLLAANTVLAASRNLTELSDSQSYQAGGLIFQHVVASLSGLKVIGIVGAPILDYTEDIEKTRFQLQNQLIYYSSVMLISAAAVSVLCIVLSIPLTVVFIGRPLRRLAKHMEEVAGFDFSSLYNPEKNMRSRITELCMIENSYWNMVTKFARGIEEIMNNRSRSSQSLN